MKKEKSDKLIKPKCPVKPTPPVFRLACPTNCWSKNIDLDCFDSVKIQDIVPKNVDLNTVIITLDTAWGGDSWSSTSARLCLTGECSLSQEELDEYHFSKEIFLATENPKYEKLLAKYHTKFADYEIKLAEYEIKLNQRKLTSLQAKKK